VKGIYLSVVVALAASIATPSPARAEGPTPDQLEAAKKAYGEGKALHEQGKLVEAIEKFKESYRLSKNPVLLYNIGLTLDEAGQKETAVLFYRKFLTDAPQTAAQRQTAVERVKVLEKEKLDADLAGPTTPPPTKDKDKDTVVATAPEPKPEQPKPAKVKIKPAGTYSASDFQHQALDTAPPGKPLDVTAFVPEDSGFVVTLYYRGKGESQFTAKQMKWRNKELVARIPAAKMNGSAVQYYIRVKDAADKTIAESGKGTDPNLISIEAGSPTHYYADMTDDNAGMVEPKHHDEDDPLGHKSTSQATTEPDGAGSGSGSGSGEQVDSPTVTGVGFLDVGSKKFTVTKWGTTIGAGVFLLGGIIFYTQASAQASNLEKDSKSCGTPPCRPFDSYDQSVQNAGHEFNALSNVGIAFGVVAAGVAGYYWYRELTTKKPHADDQPAAAAPSSDTSWIVVPSAGNGFAGAAAAVRF
jgi:hypothetical protein